MNIRNNPYHGTYLETIVNNAVSLNIHKNPKFIKFLFDKNYIVGYYGTKAKAKKEFLRLLQIFEEKYKDKVDLGFTFRNSGTMIMPHFTVLYPKFNITNSAGQSHTIRDLIVVHKVYWTENSICTGHPLGGRLTKTNYEIARGYQQSHLGGNGDWRNNPFNVSSFCLGGSSDMSRMVSELEVEIDWNRYELYLFYIDSMITWESLEGVPYQYIRDIPSVFNKEITSISYGLANSISQKILSSKKPLNLDFYVDKNRFKIKNTLRNEEWVKSFLIGEDYKSLFVHKVPNAFNKYVSAKLNGSTTYTAIERDFIYFNGVEIYSKVINLPREDFKNAEPIINPYLLKYVYESIESKLYEKAIIKARIAKHNSLDNASRSVTSDTVSM